VDDLKNQLFQHLTAARDLAAKAEAEGRDLTGEERAAVVKAMDDAKALKARLDQKHADAELLHSVLALGEGLDLTDPTAPQPRPVPAGKGRTAGERFAEAPEFAAWMKSVAPNGRIPESAKGLHSPAVQFAGIKALLTGASDTSVGALVVPDRAPGADFGYRPLTIRSLVTNGTTGSDAVEFVRETSRVNNAAPVAEATAASGTSGTKPESSFALEKVVEPVKTVAHWVPATKRAMSDSAQIRTILDAFLLAGVEEELEDQIVQGDGSGENFTGILNTSGTTAQAWSSDLLTTTRKALTAVRTVGRATPTAYVFNPADNEKLDLLREGSGSGAFLFGGPAQLGTQTLWGKPRIESEAVPEGTGIVADWRLAVLWDREQASVQVSDSHGEFFIRNLLAFLCELRAAFGVLRPAAFVEIDLTA
jgi:HK97 family phage major capsid protein